MQRRETQIGILQIGAVEVDLAEVGPLQGSPLKIGVAEIGLNQVDIAQLTSLAVFVLALQQAHQVVVGLGCRCQGRCRGEDDGHHQQQFQMPGHG